MKIDTWKFDTGSVQEPPLLWISGPCVIEGYDEVMLIAERMGWMCARHDADIVFKASFDKANRTDAKAYRGLGIDEGLRILQEVKDKIGLPITTDIHECWQADKVAEVVDVIQIPAMLSRQTDLLVAAAKTGKTINIKKSQTMAPNDISYAIDKCIKAGNDRVMVTERGTSFGYGDLVVDMRSIVTMKMMGVPVIVDVSHSTKRPASHYRSNNNLMSKVLMMSAIAAGCNGIFVETHPEPKFALSDGQCAYPLDDLPELIRNGNALRGFVDNGEFAFRGLHRSLDDVV